MGYKSKFKGAEIDEKLSTSGLFLWYIPTDAQASDYDLTEEEFEAMIAHNAEVYKVLDYTFKNRGYVPNIDLVGFVYDDRDSCYGRESFNVPYVTTWVLTENGHEPENWGSYNYGDTYMEFISEYINDALCPDGRFYGQQTGGVGPV